jgi:spore coat polysaccharide biosynthesis protein SpsF (cytidylyltransferase family)
MQKKRRKRKAFCPTGAKQIIKKCLHIARDIKQNELVYLNCCWCCCC